MTAQDIDIKSKNEKHSHVHSGQIDEVVVTVVMARVTDFFGFFVYAIASALVFPRVFFPMLDPVLGTLASFAVFSLAFLVRPIASGLSRWLTPRIGPHAKVTGALMILGTATVAIGLLPGYERIGWLAPVLLAALRILQGIGLGGAWDGLTLQLQSAAPANRQGLFAMVPQLGGPIGFVVAGALFYVLTGFLTEAEFFGFGWRFAFFAVMAVNVVSLFARVRLLNVELPGAKPERTPAPLGDMLRNQWRPILLSSFLPLASYALFHMVTVFPLGYSALFADHDLSTILMIEVIGGTLAIGSVIASGLLTDRFNRPTVIALATGLIVLLSLTVGTLDDNPAVFIILGFVILGLAYGQASAIVPDRFAAPYRYSGTAFATNLSWIIGAAFAPLVGLGLVYAFGLWAAAVYLLSGAVASAIALRVLGNGERA